MNVSFHLNKAQDKGKPGRLNQHREGHAANISLHKTKSASDSEVNQQLRGLSSFRPSYSIPLTAIEALHFETLSVCVCVCVVEGIIIKVKSDSSGVKKQTECSPESSLVRELVRLQTWADQANLLHRSNQLVCCRAHC